MPKPAPSEIHRPVPGEIPVFILCGGRGSRLRAVESRPKAIIPLAGLPLLSYPLHLLALQGFQKVHLLIGLGAEAVVASVSGDARCPTRVPAEIEVTWSKEERPLGTGGALAAVADRARPVNLVMNGDSYLEVLFEPLIARYLSLQTDPGGKAGAALFAVWAEDRSDFGGLRLDPADRIIGFEEKGEGGPGWISAGVYAVGGDWIRSLPGGAYDLEREIFPPLAREGRLSALRTRGYFCDIGTPSRLDRARAEFPWIRRRMEPEGWEQ